MNYSLFFCSFVCAEFVSRLLLFKRFGVNDLAVYDRVLVGVVLYGSVKLEIKYAVYNVICAVLIHCKTGIFCVYLAVFKEVPASDAVQRSVIKSLSFSVKLAVLEAKKLVAVLDRKSVV